KEAWSICESQQRWSLVTINPGLVLGPSLTPASESGSLSLLNQMFKGHFFYGMPDMSVTTADVREVATAHIQAARIASARGRYILADKQMISFLDMARLLRGVHKRPYVLPSRLLPGWLIRGIGPLFGLSRLYMRNHLGIRFQVNNERSIRELGIAYRPIQDT